MSNSTTHNTTKNVWIVYEVVPNLRDAPIIHGIFSSKVEADQAAIENKRYLREEYGDTNTLVKVTQMPMGTNLMFNGEPALLS